MVVVVMVCVRESEQELVIPLRHSLSGGASATELIKASAARSLHRNTNKNTKKKKREESLALSGGSDYTMRLQLGKGKEAAAWVYMDTGSDLVWFPCRPFTCILCEGEAAPLAPPLDASSLGAAAVSCASPLCAAAHSVGASDLCAAAGCPLDAIETSDCSLPCPLFYYAYADGSLVGRLHTHAVSVSPTLRLPALTFACAHSALAEPVGVAGFGRGPLSMTAQLAPHIGAAFSYCLVSHSFNSSRSRSRSSPLILGRQHQRLQGFAYTAMLENPKRPYLYSVGLLGVTVGNATVEAPPFLRRVDAAGRGGMVVDSGTTFTMLPAAMHDAVVAEFERQLRPAWAWERAREVERNTGLMPCYAHRMRRAEVPRVALRFAGEAEAVVLPRRNYWYEMRSAKVGCLTVMNGGAEQDAATLGNYQQQGLEVLYDLENRRIGFANRKCDQLWDSLNPTPTPS